RRHREMLHCCDCVLSLGRKGVSLSSHFCSNTRMVPCNSLFSLRFRGVRLFEGPFVGGSNPFRIPPAPFPRRAERSVVLATECRAKASQGTLFAILNL